MYIEINKLRVLSNVYRAELIVLWLKFSKLLEWILKALQLSLGKLFKIVIWLPI